VELFSTFKGEPYPERAGWDDERQNYRDLMVSRAEIERAYPALSQIRRNSQRPAPALSGTAPMWEYVSLSH
jgi:hypothetical protein